jgi:ribosomal protein S18 acetylase RimI-like enzyme
MRIEELDESAIDEATTLWEHVGLTRTWNDAADDFHRAVRGATSGVLGAYEGDTLVGTAMLGSDGHRGWVYYLVVASSYQRRGVGRCLMQRAEEWLAERDAPKVQLMVRDTNEVAMGFYEHLGYGDAHVTVLGRWLNQSK